ncbi:hypothetical protein BJV74DRAFT_553765 [Russula compacta]|nr:hypothetical protein BJV74DRAFT_553765 [Russula compacta]
MCLHRRFLREAVFLPSQPANGLVAIFPQVTSQPVPTCHLQEHHCVIRTESQDGATTGHNIKPRMLKTSLDPSHPHLPSPMQAKKVPLLDRILMVMISCALIFTGLCIYNCLVAAYEGRRPRHAPSHLPVKSWPATCVHHARWAPIDSQQAPGHPETSQSHAWFTQPADDFETLLLMLQDRHASGVVYFAQSAGATTNSEVGVLAFDGSEKALRSEMRTICALRRSQGQYGTGVFAGSGHPYSARDDDITSKITFCSPQPRSEAAVDFRVMPWLESDSLQSRHVVGDSPLHPFGLSRNAPIEADTVGSMSRDVWYPQDIPVGKRRIVAPDHGRFNVAHESIAAGVSAYINNDSLPMSINFSVTDAQMVRRISLSSIHDSKSGGFFRVHAHSPNSPLGMRFFESASGSAPDSDVNSASEILDLYLCPTYEDSFELLAAAIRPPMNAKPSMEHPVERSHTRRVTSRIVGRGVCLSRGDVE